MLCCTISYFLSVCRLSQFFSLYYIVLCVLICADRLYDLFEIFLHDSNKSVNTNFYNVFFCVYKQVNKYLLLQ